MAVFAVVAVLAAGGGVAFWLARSHHPNQSALAARTAAPSGAGSPSANGSSSSAEPPTPPASPVSSGILTVAPAVSQDADAPAVESFLNSYFSAINGHNYQQYQALLDQQMQQDEPAQAFYNGYGSTTDSDATLTAISSTGPGQVSAAVTFTSHQSPSESPTDSACTSWNITLFLTGTGTGYVLGPAPADYHAVYQAC